MSYPDSFLRSLEAPDYFALCFAFALTVLIALVLHRSWGPWVVLAAAFVPVPVVALFSREFDFVGWHGFMHASPIYQIMAHGGAPEDPLYAGGALRYPWAEFWLAATAARLSGANPLVLTLIAQTIAYLAFVVAAAWLAAAVTTDRLTIALSALLSAFGISIFHVGLLAEPLGRAFPPLWLENRVVPLDKFLSLTAMPIGYAAMLLAAAASVRLAAGLGSPRRLLLGTAGGTLVAVFIHPLSWLGVLAMALAAGLVLATSKEPGRLQRTGQLALAVALPSALALPYLRSLGASESSDGWMGVTRPAALFEAKLADLGFFLAVFLLLAYLARHEILRRLRERERALMTLLLAILGFSITYLAFHAPGRNEYKFMLQLTPAAAVVMALSLRSLLERQRALALGLLFLLLLPGGRMLGVRPWFKVTDPARLEGQYQRAEDPVVDELYQWVSSHTPQNAVVLAADLRMPALGRRSLYIAVDAPWRGRDGWGLPRNSLLQWHIRRPDREMWRRQSLATTVLSPDWASPAADVLAQIQADVPGRPIWVHSSFDATSAKLDRTPGFSREFRNAAGSIYRWDPPASRSQ